MRSAKQKAAQLKAAKASAAKRRIKQIKKEYEFVSGIHHSDPRRGPALVKLMGEYKEATKMSGDKTSQ